MNAYFDVKYKKKKEAQRSKSAFSVFVIFVLWCATSTQTPKFTFLGEREMDDRAHVFDVRLHGRRHDEFYPEYLEMVNKIRASETTGSVLHRLTEKHVAQHKRVRTALEDMISVKRKLRYASKKRRQGHIRVWQDSLAFLVAVEISSAAARPASAPGLRVVSPKEEEAKTP